MIKNASEGATFAASGADRGHDGSLLNNSALSKEMKMQGHICGKGDVKPR